MYSYPNQERSEYGLDFLSVPNYYALKRKSNKEES